MLHGALVVLLLHVQPVREVFGQRPAEEEEWVWLPEVTWLAVAPEPTRAEPLPEENVPPPPTDPEPETIDESEPLPEPPPPAEIAGATNRPDAWTEVRDGIVAALRYPALARRRGTEGAVRLRLELDEAGHVAALDIQPPQPARALGDAVRSAVRRAEPFPAAGESIRRGEIPPTAVLAIRFKLE